MTIITIGGHFITIVEGYLRPIHRIKSIKPSNCKERQSPIDEWK